MEDPWIPLCIPQEGLKDVSTDNCFQFEDNFEPRVRDILPDSEEYLLTLERRLEKIKKDPDLLRQLRERRDACMRQLLSGEQEYNTENLEFDIPVYQSDLIRQILPEQALTIGEALQLLHYDSLDTEDKENSETPDN